MSKASDVMKDCVAAVREHEQDAEIAMLEVLEACGMVNASWTYARAKDDRLCRCVNRLLDV